MNDTHRPDTVQDHKQRMLRVLVHIQQHLDEPLPLEALADVACYSPFHFHRVFRGMIGESVKEHVRRLRLERAAHRLKFSDEPVVHLAFEAGFETHETFTRAFTAAFEVTPSAYRKRHRAIQYPVSCSGVHYEPNAALDDFNFQPSEETNMNVWIATLPAARLAFVQHIGPYDGVGEAWGKLMAWAGPKGLLGPRMRFFGLCFSDPEVTPPDKIQYQACLEVGPEVKPEGEVGVQEFAGGEYAAVTHKGPYRTLGEAYALICGQWLPNSGRTLGPPPSVERYLNDPRGTPEDQLLTEVYIRVV